MVREIWGVPYCPRCCNAMAKEGEKHCEECKKQIQIEINKAYWETYPLHEKAIQEAREAKNGQN